MEDGGIRVPSNKTDWRGASRVRSASPGAQVTAPNSSLAVDTTSPVETIALHEGPRHGHSGRIRERLESARLRPDGGSLSAGWIAAETTCYMIVFTLRSGSNLLCDFLRANGLGQPSEYFQHPLGVANAAYYQELGVAPDDFKTFLTRLLTEKRQNGIFGVKLTWDHKNVLVDALRRHFGRSDGLLALSPRQRWIYLRRRDRIGQAISLWRALKSGAWTSSAPRGGEAGEVGYDFFRLLGLLQAILTEEYLWEEFFQTHGIEPVRVFYEDLLRAPAAAVLRVARAVQEAAGVELIRCEADVRLGTNLAVQRDRRSAELAARMHDDLDHLGVTDYWQPRAQELARWLRFFEGEGWKREGRDE
jgi:LPS sulfotransferase NodH